MLRIIPKLDCGIAKIKQIDHEQTGQRDTGHILEDHIDG